MPTTNNSTPLQSVVTTAGTIAGSAIGMPWLGTVAGGITSVAQTLFGGGYDPEADALAREQFILARTAQLEGTAEERRAIAEVEFLRFKREFMSLPKEEQQAIILGQRRRAGATTSVLPGSQAAQVIETTNTYSSAVLDSGLDTGNTGFNGYQNAATPSDFYDSDSNSSMIPTIGNMGPIVVILLLIWAVFKK